VSAVGGGRVVNVWGRDGVRGCGGHCACAAGSEGACTATCWEVASGDGAGVLGGAGGALRRAAWGVGRRARRERALDKATVGVGGGEGGGVW